MTCFCAAAALGMLLQAPASPAPSVAPGNDLFTYDAAKPVDVKLEPAKSVVQQLTYAQLDGRRNAATLVTPSVPGRGPRPVILYLHWYEPPRPTSNRIEFLAEA